MDNRELQARLMKTFVVELEDHVGVLNEALLQIEKASSEEIRAEPLRGAFRAAHSLKGAARAVGQEVLEACCQQLESILVSKQGAGAVFEERLFGLLYAATDAIETLGRALVLGAATAEPEAALRRLARQLEAAADGHLPADGEAAAAVQAQRGTGQPAAAEDSAAMEPAAREAGSLSGQVRVSGEKLDRLMAMSGELQVARMHSRGRSEDVERLKAQVQSWRERWSQDSSHLARLASRAAGEEGRPNRLNRAGGRRTQRALQSLADIGERLERLERDLEHLRAQLAADRKEVETAAIPIERAIHEIRMLPFQQVCDGLNRAVRDLAVASGRQVALSIEGGDLELDRAILEALRPPLLQLVRNAVDHGIEQPEDRAAAAKDPQGQITISAALEGSRVRIRIADDGRGLDLQAVAERGRAGGLAVPQNSEAIADLIFAPGISTAQSVTSLSGRGVGLDVVRTTVASLRGAVSVHSTRGRGTQFEISLPLTTSAFAALLLRLGKASFAVDLESVVRVLPVLSEDVVSINGRHFLVIDERQVPVLHLGALLGLNETPRAEADSGAHPMAVVMTDGAREAAFIVDGIVGNEELVTKRLGKRLQRVPFVAGASLLPGGELALILNAPGLIAACSSAVPRQAPLQQAGDEERRRRRLLVVEDSMTTRMLEVSVLQSAGYHVEAAADGVDAWALLESIEIDLVVTDLEMPRMDGIELTETIRKTARTRDIPVILLTARETEQDKLRGLQAGADAYLVKSAFDQAALIESIQRLLP